MTFPAPLYCDFLSLPREECGSRQPSASPTRRNATSHTYCEGFQQIQLPPAWGCSDSSASSPVGEAPPSGAGDTLA